MSEETKVTPFKATEMPREAFLGGLNISLDFALNILVNALTHFIPTNGSSQKKYKSVLLKIFRIIGNIYKDDSTFSLKEK